MKGVTNISYLPRQQSLSPVYEKKIEYSSPNQQRSLIKAQETFKERLNLYSTLRTDLQQSNLTQKELRASSGSISQNYNFSDRNVKVEFIPPQEDQITKRLENEEEPIEDTFNIQFSIVRPQGQSLTGATEKLQSCENEKQALNDQIARLSADLQRSQDSILGYGNEVVKLQNEITMLDGLLWDSRSKIDVLYALIKEQLNDLILIERKEQTFSEVYNRRTADLQAVASFLETDHAIFSGSFSDAHQKMGTQRQITTLVAAENRKSSAIFAPQNEFKFQQEIALLKEESNRYKNELDKLKDELETLQKNRRIGQEISQQGSSFTKSNNLVSSVSKRVEIVTGIEEKSVQSPAMKAIPQKSKIKPTLVTLVSNQDEIEVKCPNCSSNLALQVADSGSYKATLLSPGGTFHKQNHLRASAEKLFLFPHLGDHIIPDENVLDLPEKKVSSRFQSHVPSLGLQYSPSYTRLINKESQARYAHPDEILPYFTTPAVTERLPQSRDNYQQDRFEQDRFEKDSISYTKHSVLKTTGTRSNQLNKETTKVTDRTNYQQYYNTNKWGAVHKQVMSILPNEGNQGTMPALESTREVKEAQNKKEPEPSVDKTIATTHIQNTNVTTVITNNTTEINAIHQIQEFLCEPHKHITCHICFLKFEEKIKAKEKIVVEITNKEKEIRARFEKLQMEQINITRERAKNIRNLEDENSKLKKLVEIAQNSADYKKVLELQQELDGVRGQLDELKFFFFPSQIIEGEFEDEIIYVDGTTCADDSPGTFSAAAEEDAMVVETEEVINSEKPIETETQTQIEPRKKEFGEAEALKKEQSKIEEPAIQQPKRVEEVKNTQKPFKKSTKESSEQINRVDDERIKAIKERLQKFIQKLKDEGLKDCGLILGIDCTASNIFTGRRSFGNRHLHDISNRRLNFYEQVIGIIGSVVNEFTREGKFPVYIFGDDKTRDRTVRPLYTNKAGTSDECFGVEHVLAEYRKKIVKIGLSGPTSFRPLIDKAIEIAKEKAEFQLLMIIGDGAVSDLQDTVRSIVEASNYPIAIVMVGVGDGDFKQFPNDPWKGMKKLDDMIPDRKFDNFNFINFDPKMIPEEFAENAMDELSDAYKFCVENKMIEALQLKLREQTTAAQEGEASEIKLEESDKTGEDAPTKLKRANTKKVTLKVDDSKEVAEVQTQGLPKKDDSAAETIILKKKPSSILKNDIKTATTQDVENETEDKQAASSKQDEAKKTEIAEVEKASLDSKKDPVEADKKESEGSKKMPKTVKKGSKIEESKEPVPKDTVESMNEEKEEPKNEVQEEKKDSSAAKKKDTKKAPKGSKKEEGEVQKAESKDAKKTGQDSSIEAQKTKPQLQETTKDVQETKSDGNKKEETKEPPKKGSKKETKKETKETSKIEGTEQKIDVKPESGKISKASVQNENKLDKSGSDAKLLKADESTTKKGSKKSQEEEKKDLNNKEEASAPTGKVVKKAVAKKKAETIESESTEAVTAQKEEKKPQETEALTSGAAAKKVVKKVVKKT